jgi:CRISPR/Cas system-associated exonuclease Cas4 (RecB family)
MYKLSPSKAHRFLNCTKSLEFDVPFVETPQTVRGQILHELAQLMLNNKESQDFIKENKINEYELYLIDGYVNQCWNEYHYVSARTKGLPIIQVEQKKPIAIYNNQINLIVDCLIIGDKIASIVDLKSGNGDIEVEDNEQLYFYAYMVASDYKDIEVFRLNIYQKGKLKTIEIVRKEVLDFFIDKYEVFDNINKRKLEYNPSDKACKFCPIKDTCIARAKWIIGGKK